mgnify:CR=1 FL=1
MSNVTLKTLRDVEALRIAGQKAAETLLGVGPLIKPGITTDDIDAFVRADTKRLGGICAPLNYKGFPKSVCTSINEVVCHGIPTTKHVLKDGDIINVDVTTLFNGYHGDTSATFYVGKPSPAALKVTEVARTCLDLAIAEVRERSWLLHRQIRAQAPHGEVFGRVLDLDEEGHLLLELADGSVQTLASADHVRAVH